MDNLKKLLVLTTIGVALGVSLFFISNFNNFGFSEPKVSEKADLLETQISAICENLDNWEATLICKDKLIECEKAFDNALSVCTCVAINIIELDQEAAKNICDKLDGEESYFCFADALRNVDIDEALEQCNFIENVDHRIFCEANALKSYDNEMALEKCGLIEDLGARLSCESVVKEVS